MMVIEKFLNYATGRNVLVLFLLTTSVYAWILLVSIPAVLSKAPELILFDMSPLGYSMEFAMSLLDGIGEEGRRTYLRHQLPVDFIYPGLFAVTYALMLAWLLGKTSSKPTTMVFLASVPLCAGAFDYLENICIISMLNAYPDLSPSIVRISSSFTILKSLLTVVLYGLVLYAFCAWGLKARARSSAGDDTTR